MKTVNILGCKTAEEQYPGDVSLFPTNDMRDEINTEINDPMDTTHFDGLPESEFNSLTESDHDVILSSFVDSLVNLYDETSVPESQHNVFLEISLIDETQEKWQISPSPTDTEPTEQEEATDAVTFTATEYNFLPEPSLTSYQSFITENVEPKQETVHGFSSLFEGVTEDSFYHVLTCLTHGHVSLNTILGGCSLKNLHVPITVPATKKPTVKVTTTATSTTSSTSTADICENDTGGKQKTTVTLKPVSTTTKHSVLPVDKVTPKRRQNPHLPIAHPSTPTPRPTPVSTRRPRIIWNVTLTQFPDPDDHNALIWGLVVSVSFSVFGLAVGLVCYCHYKHGGLQIRTRATVRYDRDAGTIANMGAESVPLSEVKTDVETVGQTSPHSAIDDDDDEDNTVFSTPPKDYQATRRRSPSPAAAKTETVKKASQMKPPATLKPEASVAGALRSGIGVPTGKQGSSSPYYLPGMIQCGSSSIQEGDEKPFDKDK